MKLENVWPSLRGVLLDNLSFNNIKKIMGSCGLPIQKINHLVQKKVDGASKGQLMDGIDGLFEELYPEEKDKFINDLIVELIKSSTDLTPMLDEKLKGFGFSIYEGNVVTSSIHIDIDTSDLPNNVSASLVKALDRIRRNDIDGAFTAICSMVDSMTQKFYKDNNLGDHFHASYQERVTKSFSTLENSFKVSLKYSSISSEEIINIWDGFKRAINGSAYMLGSFRINFSDTHGVKDAPPELIQTGINCAIFVIRSLLMQKIEDLAPDHPYNKTSDYIKRLLLHVAERIGRNRILNSPEIINEEFRKTSFSKIDSNKMKEEGIIDINRDLTDFGIDLFKGMALNMMKKTV